MSSSSSKKPNELWPLTTTNNPPVCTIDDQDMNSSDVEEKSNDKKRRRKNQTINIDSDLLVDRYHSTQKSIKIILMLCNIHPMMKVNLIRHILRIMLGKKKMKMKICD